jgi:hypothetical protein
MIFTYGTWRCEGVRGSQADCRTAPGTGVEVVPDGHKRGVELPVGGVEQGDVVTFAEAASFALAVAVHDRAVDEPAAPAGPVAGQPSESTHVRIPYRTPGSPGSDRDGPRSGLSVGAASDRPRPQSRSTHPAAPLPFSRWPRLPPPQRDRPLVAFDLHTGIGPGNRRTDHGVPTGHAARSQPIRPQHSTSTATPNATPTLRISPPCTVSGSSEVK